MSLVTITENIIKLLRDYWQVFLLRGVSITLLLSVITVFFGAILGSLLAFARMSRFKMLRWPVAFFVELIRGTPILLQLYIGYFVAPQVFPFLGMSDFASIAVALIINSACYVSEIVRSGIQAVDKTQNEAARSLGLNPAQAMVLVVLPQAVKNILPALGNEFVTVIKETSLASTFFVGDLMTQYSTVRGTMFLVLEPLVVVGVIYFLLTFFLSKLVNSLERRMKASD